MATHGQAINSIASLHCRSEVDYESRLFANTSIDLSETQRSGAHAGLATSMVAAAAAALSSLVAQNERAQDAARNVGALQALLR